MRVLLLIGQQMPRIAKQLADLHETVLCHSGKIDSAFMEQARPDFIVSYGYRHIISSEIVEKYERKMVNLHISFLPYNRGADPNFWSIWEDSPKGVTIHYIDKGLDTGDILFQKEVVFSEEDSLSSSYEILRSEIESMFLLHWDAIKTGRCHAYAQKGQGSTHKAADFLKLNEQLQIDWNIRIGELKKRRIAFNL